MCEGELRPWEKIEHLPRGKGKGGQKMWEKEEGGEPAGEEK